MDSARLHSLGASHVSTPFRIGRIALQL